MVLQVQVSGLILTHVFLSALWLFLTWLHLT